jgi:hypothetical protein
MSLTDAAKKFFGTTTTEQRDKIKGFFHDLARELQDLGFRTTVGYVKGTSTMSQRQLEPIHAEVTYNNQLAHINIQDESPYGIEATLQLTFKPLNHPSMTVLCKTKNNGEIIIEWYFGRAGEPISITSWAGREEVELAIVRLINDNARPEIVQALKPKELAPQP